MGDKFAISDFGNPLEADLAASKSRQTRPVSYVRAASLSLEKLITAIANRPSPRSICLSSARPYRIVATARAFFFSDRDNDSKSE